METYDLCRRYKVLLAFSCLFFVKYEKRICKAAYIKLEGAFYFFYAPGSDVCKVEVDISIFLVFDSLHVPHNLLLDFMGHKTVYPNLDHN